MKIWCFFRAKWLLLRGYEFYSGYDFFWNPIAKESLALNLNLTVYELILNPVYVNPYALFAATLN